MFIEKLFEKAIKAGISDVQVFLNNMNELSIEVFDGQLEKYEISDSSSMVIRGIYQGKMGTYSTEIMDESLIDTIVNTIIESAKIIDSPDEAMIYAGDKEYKELNDLYNEELKTMDVSKKIEKVKNLDALFHAADPRVSIVETMYAEQTKTVMLQNTKGLKLFNKVNSSMLGGQVIVKNETDQRTGFDLLITNDFNDYNNEELSRKVVEDAVKTLGAKPIPSGNYEIVFDRDAFGILLSAFSGIFSAEAVHKGASLLKGKLGSTIGSSHVTLVDDPFMKKSSRSRSFDDEGVATKYKELVKEGVLTTFLHNLNTAKKDQVTSTGNGFGGTVSAVNLALLPGNHSKDELIKMIKNGIYVTDVQGAHAGANSVSGDFSLQAMGFVVKEGVIGAPVALITVAGNFIKMLQDIEALGNDTKTGYYGITCPSVKVGPMVVAGL
ncbi:MAG: TldD/PmbA family protein [Tenericutes bacterium HGW-Tenericutes-1]|jgi:PmbA protein|nr:MAG: TldD/PmbA family protein [Tenericutes bacterium HGW-Tenericutes-1]